MSSNLDSTSSTASPPDSPNPPMAIATRIPPELLLYIFSVVSNSPSEGSEVYFERNRNLKYLALVHSAWKDSAQQILQEEVFIPGTDSGEASDEEVGRIAMLLLDSKLEGTKYLTVDAHLNDLIARTGCAMWSQIRYANLLTSSRNDGTTQLSDFASFPRLQYLQLDDFTGASNLLWFDPSDVNLQFPYLHRIILGLRVRIGSLSQPEAKDDAWEGDLATLIPITHQLFSPSNMPNLVHLALYGYSETTLPTHMILLAKVLPQITTLAIIGTGFDLDVLSPENRLPDNLRHLSLNIDDSDLLSLFSDDGMDLESLHLSSWTMKRDGEVMSRLIRIAKGADPTNTIMRIVVYGKRKEIEAIYKDLVDDLDSLEWREDSEHPPFEDFDGR
ncbi:hypothetical protein JCM5353_005537 [Sporobolomyces roseus]